MKKERKAVLIVLISFVIIFGAITVFAYLQSNIEIIQGSSFINLPEITVPLYYESGEKSGDVTVTISILLESDQSGTPDQFVNNVDSALRDLSHSQVTSQGNINSIQDSIRTNLNNAGLPYVDRVFVSDIFLN